MVASDGNRQLVADGERLLLVERQERWLEVPLLLLAFAGLICGAYALVRVNAWLVGDAGSAGALSLVAATLTIWALTAGGASSLWRRRTQKRLLAIFDFEDGVLRMPDGSVAAALHDVVLQSRPLGARLPQRRLTAEWGAGRLRIADEVVASAGYVEMFLALTSRGVRADGDSANR